MKKMIMVLLGAFLMMSLAWAGLALAADPKTKDQDLGVCPVMGAKNNPKLYVDHNGQRIYFCCPGCIDAFKKDPGKYLKKQEN